MNFRSSGNRFGVHRVLEPAGALAQAARKLDCTLPPFDNEILVNVDALQIDSASFHQLVAEAQGHPEKIKELVRTIVASRGKMHNPTTNSGGVFLGRVADVGPEHPFKNIFKEGDQVVSLVSLTLTPLELTEISAVNIKKERLAVSGHALVFESGMLAKMPDDLPEGLVLACLDVCGAPAQTARLVKKGETVLVIGLGKAGRSVALQAGVLGARVLGVDASEKAVEWSRKNLQGSFETVNASDALAVFEWTKNQTQGTLADTVIHATNVDSTEMSGILPCKDGGRVLFFGMNTSFQKAVLGAEGMGKDVSLLMGNGYVPGHAELMLNLVRQHRPLREWFEENFA